MGCEVGNPVSRSVLIARAEMFPSLYPGLEYWTVSDPLSIQARLCLSGCTLVSSGSAQVVSVCVCQHLHNLAVLLNLALC